MGSTKDQIQQMHRKCAGKKCQNQGIHYLKVLYLNKSGWFCKSCKDNLVSDHLVIEDKWEDNK